MEGKKKYFALIIFLFLGLMIFTFANPAEEEKEFKGGDKEQSETVTNKRQDTTEEDDEDEQDQQQVQQNLVTNNNQGNAQGGNQGNNPGQTPVVPEDTTLRDALAAVEKAEGTYTQNDVNAAKDLVNNVTDTTEKGKLEERLEEVEAGINALALLENLEKQVEEANKKADMNDATDYRNENEIANKIEALKNETVKEELSKRLEEVSKLLDDNAAPTTNIEAKVYADNVEITAEDEAGNPFKMYLAKGNGKEKEISSGDKTTSDGVYTLRLVDEAFNEQTVTFTVDTTAPALKDLTSGAHYPEITLNTEDLTKVKIEVTNMDKNETTEVEDGTKLTEDATYKVTLTDEAGNTTTYWLAIDTTKPTVSIDDKEVEEKTYINENKEVKVFDKFLTNVSITHEDTKGNKTTEEITRVDFEVGARNENFTLTYELTKAGTYTIAATDKYGNTTTKTIIVDKVLSIDKLAIIGANGQWKDKEYIQYAKTGTTVYVNARFKEELATTPIVMLNNKVKLTNATKKESNGIWIYSYKYKLVEDDGLEDGTLQVKVTNIKDFAGNTAELTNEHMTMESQSEVVVDRTLPTFRFTKAGSSLAKDEITPLVKDGVYYFNQHVRVTLSDSVNLRLHGIDSYYDDKNAKRTGWLKDVKTDGLHTAVAVDAAGNRLEFKFVVDTTGPEIKLPGTAGKNKNEMIVESGTKVTLEDVIAKVVDNIDGEWTIEPYKADLLISNVASENKYNYDFKNGFDTNYSGRYNIYYTVKDFAGNETQATMLLVMKDTTSAEIILPGQEGNDKNQYRILEDSYIPVSRLNAEYKDIVDGTGEIQPKEIWAFYPSVMNKPAHKYDLIDGKYFDTSIVGVNYRITYEYKDKSGNVSSKNMLLIVDPLYEPEITNNEINLNYNLTLNDRPFYNDKERTEPLTINGNGKTITQEIDTDYKYTWDITGTRPMQSNMFTSANNSLVTVNDLNFAGSMYSITLGHYRSSNQGGFTTVLNNVNVINTKVASFSGGLSPAMSIYGKATLNNVNVYGTTLSELDKDPQWPVYDVIMVNNTDTTINGGKIGTIFTWPKAYLEINNAEIGTIDTQIEYRTDYTKAGLVIGENTKVEKIIIKENKAVVTIKSTAEVGTLDLCAYGPAEMKLNIEQGAKIDKVVLKDGDSCKEMSYDEWYKSTTPITVNSVDEFKTALSEGYTNVIIATTLNVEENETFKAEKATVVTTKGTITMFNVKEGKSLTLENLILDGENKYKVNVANSADMHNDPFNIFGEITSEQTKVYENKPLIITAGTLTLGNGTVIRNYAHQPVNGTAKQQYAGPAVLVTGGSVTINDLEFTNNVSQLLTAKNANITINNINVHDTWANGNKAGLIEINTGATMDVNNGTFKNNMMSMRSYGLFIANAGTINMKGGHYENNNSTRNGSNTAGSLFGVESTGKIYMTGGTVINNIGYRAGAFATRWATEGSIIELNGGTIKNNTTRKADFKNAGLFVQSDVKIGLNMTVEDKVVLRGKDAELNNNGTIAGDVELVDNLGTFNNNGSVTGNIIVPQP